MMIELREIAAGEDPAVLDAAEARDIHQDGKGFFYRLLIDFIHRRKSLEQRFDPTADRIDFLLRPSVFDELTEADLAAIAIAVRLSMSPDRDDRGGFDFFVDNFAVIHKSTIEYTRPTLFAI